MRIVAGSAKGRTLDGPKGQDTLRPTSDRVRGTIFNVLGQWCDGFRVLDVFAGTGALGLEALSRGAETAVFIDQGREAQQLIRANAERCGFAKQIDLIPFPFERGLAECARRKTPFDLVFVDPPYALEAGGKTLALLDELQLVKVAGRVCLEGAEGEVWPEQQGALARVDLRTIGQTQVALYTRG